MAEASDVGGKDRDFDCLYAPEKVVAVYIET